MDGYHPAAIGTSTLAALGFERRLRAASKADLLDDLATGRTDLLGPLDDASRGPLQVTLVGFGAVFIEGGEATRLEAAAVSGDALILAKQFDSGVGQADAQGLMDEVMGKPPSP